MIDTKELGPRSAVLGVLAAVILLTVAHIFQPVFPSSSEPAPPVVAAPDVAPPQEASCVTMPDGVRVCDRPGEAGEQPKPKVKDQ